MVFIWRILQEGYVTREKLDIIGWDVELLEKFCKVWAFGIL